MVSNQTSIPKGVFPSVINVDYGKEHGTVAVPLFQTGFEVSHEDLLHKVYYASAWTGIKCAEEIYQAHIKKMLHENFQKTYERTIAEMLRYGRSKPRTYHDDGVDAFAYGMQAVKLKKKPFIKRFMNSYYQWRINLGVFASLKAAWRISNG